MSLTKAEEKLWDDLARKVGCIACLVEFGIVNTYVSIHHIDGRTKKGAHSKVLPLCAGHHQDGTGEVDLVAVHPFKTRFENKFGKQEDLLKKCLDILGRQND